MATVFYLIAASLTLIAVGIVVLAIIRKPPDLSVDRRQKNIEVARQRLADLRQARALSQIDSADADVLQEEIERGLLQDTEQATPAGETDDKATDASGAGHIGVVLVTALLIPFAAVGLYLALGSPHLISDKFDVAQDVASVNRGNLGQDANLSLEQQISMILADLETQPANAQLWEQLGMTYVQTGNYAAAATAFETIRQVGDDTVTSMLLEAQAWSFTGTGSGFFEAEKLVKQALQIEPNNATGLVIAGVLAAQKGDHQTALTNWERAKALLPPAQRAQINELLEDAQAKLNQSVSAKSGEGSGAVRVHVSVDPKVASQVNLNDTVFVFAHASSGPRMPLAVVKKQVKDLPIEIALTDAMAMVPNMKLSAFDEVAVVARISKSGSAEAGQGDFFGQTEAFRPQDESLVSVTISEPVQ